MFTDDTFVYSAVLFMQGVTYPAMHVLISRWAAPAQRSRIATAVYAGVCFVNKLNTLIV